MKPDSRTHFYWEVMTYIKEHLMCWNPRLNQSLVYSLCWITRETREPWTTLSLCSAAVHHLDIYGIPPSFGGIKSTCTGDTLHPCPMHPAWLVPAYSTRDFNQTRADGTKQESESLTDVECRHAMRLTGGDEEDTCQACVDTVWEKVSIWALGQVWNSRKKGENMRVKTHPSVLHLVVEWNF